MTTTNERALASIRIISEIKPHTNADKLELAMVDGWQCVVVKGDYKAGDMVIYIEIDSWVPNHIAAFLSKGKEPREFEGIKGERLRTMKLRGELSQGLIMPMRGIIPEYRDLVSVEGTDVTGLLGIKKYEKPLNPQMQGVARGNFPGFLRKTDQERIQNIFRKLDMEKLADRYEATLKVDGSSATYYVRDGEVGACSRNLELKVDGENADNTFVKVLKDSGLDQRLLEFNQTYGRNIALQGELWGAGINGNWEGVSDHRYNVFDIFDIDKQKYLPALERMLLCKLIGVDHVPMIEHITLESFTSVDDFLAYADRPSIHNKIAEGVVFKSLTNPEFSFKIINNKYLLNGGE